jgi:hypothetical protein
MKKKQSAWGQVMLLQSDTQKNIKKIEEEFEIKRQELSRQENKQISACTKDYAQKSFPLLAEYKSKGQELSKSEDEMASLQGFILLLLISENLFFKESTYLKSDNDRESIKVSRTFTGKDFTIVVTASDSGSLIFEIKGAFDSVFGEEVASLEVNGRYFINSHSEGPNRSGNYDEADATRRVLNILKFHFSKKKK